MPPLTRWAAKTAMIYLVTGLLAGVLVQINTQHFMAGWINAFNPTYLHMLIVGWLTQFIFAVIYWMFPIISKHNMRGNPRLAWSTYITLNIGLLLRVVCEPAHMLQPSPLTQYGLLASAVLQVVAGVLLVTVCWPRVRERAGS